MLMRRWLLLLFLATMAINWPQLPFNMRATDLVFVAAAVAFPVVVGLVAYGLGWATGLAGYVAPPGGFLAGLLVAATVTTVLSCVSAAGEEIGWRATCSRGHRVKEPWQ